MIEIKSRGELEAMRAAGIVVARALDLLTKAVKPGVSTAELDELAEQTIRDAGAVPSFKGDEVSSRVIKALDEKSDGQA